MRTLSTQVRLRRLIRSFDEAVNRLISEPHERRMAGSTVARLLELAGEVREAWKRENAATPLPRSLERYVRDTLRTIDLAIAGVQQAGADLELLRQDFEGAALPLEIFMRGLDSEPALQRSA
jgi:NTP pyrophosphatase (non-canonical NTP hydrolase)